MTVADASAGRGLVSLLQAPSGSFQRCGFVAIHHQKQLSNICFQSLIFPPSTPYFFFFYHAAVFIRISSSGRSISPRLEQAKLRKSSDYDTCKRHTTRQLRLQKIHPAGFAAAFVARIVLFLYVGKQQGPKCSSQLLLLGDPTHLPLLCFHKAYSGPCLWPTRLGNCVFFCNGAGLLQSR